MDSIFKMGDQLSEKFWQRRHNKLNEEVQEHLQSLHTWAILLNKACDNRDQWRMDKQDITGVPCTLQPEMNERAIAQTIINYTVNGIAGIARNVDIRNRSNKTNHTRSNKVNREARGPKHNREFKNKQIYSNFEDAIVDTREVLSASDNDVISVDSRCNNRTTTAVDNAVADDADVDNVDDAVEIDDNDDADVEVELGKHDMDPDTLQAFTEVALEKHKTEQEILESHMNKRRSKLLKEQTQDMTILDDETKTVVPATADVKVKFLLDTTGEQYKDNDEQPKQPKQPKQNQSGLTPYNPAIHKFAGKNKGTPEEQARKAPTASPLLSLSSYKRDELMYNLFKQAKQNVTSSIGTNTLTEDEKEKLIHQETDRLLKSWIDTHKFRR